jgi:hypothetical protein
MPMRSRGDRHKPTTRTSVCAGTRGFWRRLEMKDAGKNSAYRSRAVAKPRLDLSTDAQAVATHCRRSLRLGGARLPDEYFYRSLSLCVIDAVFSIGVRYEGVKNVVARYREHARMGVPNGRDSEPLTALITRMNENGPEWFAENVFRNRQRTSTRSGILKSDAVLRFARVLAAHGVSHRDVLSLADLEAIENAVRRIPGQRSGISFQYFLMLAGDDDLIKPDRMIQRFLTSAIGRFVRVDDCRQLIIGALSFLRPDHPHLTPRLLDWLIWNHQRAQAAVEH